MSFWDDHQADLERWAAEGLTGSQIAERLGVTRNAVMGRAHRSGVTLVPTPAKRMRLNAQIADLRRREWANPHMRDKRLVAFAKARAARASVA